MELIKADSIFYKNGRTDILNSASFRIIDGENYGLIGPNGSGKTTLIRILMDELETDKGTLHKKKNLVIGYVPQKQEFGKEQSIAEFMKAELEPVRKKIADIEEKMSTATGSALNRLLPEYQKAQEKFEQGGGYQAEEKGESFLNRLGLDNSMNQTMGSLSGGERSLVYFARALISEPELLILDEPGNHLDYLGLAWLESFLSSYQKAALIVSHNRYLLDKTCAHLISMDTGTLTEYTGSYSSYRIDVLRKAVQDKNAYETGRKKMASLEKKVKQLQSIAMAQYNPPKKIMVQLNVFKKKLAEEKETLPDRPSVDDSSISLDINSESSKSTTAVRVENYSAGFDEKLLLDDASMEVFCGQRVALVGPNGCGKSTLLRELMDEGDWHHDHLKIGPSQKIGYLSQVPEFTPGAVSVEDEIRSWGALTKNEAYAIAASFSFEYEDMDKRLEVLSGGETNRLQLARFNYFRTNLLILDEPTNHMDIISKEAIEEALDQFEGTMLIVSHDRFFLDNLVERVYEFADKKLVCYEGNFTEYFKKRYPVLLRLSGSATSRGNEKKKENQKISKSSPVNIERRISEAEAEKKELEKEMKNAIDGNNQSLGRKTAVKLEKVSALLEKLYAEWENSIS